MSGGGWYYRPEIQPTPKRPDPPEEPTPTDQRLLRDYQNLRLDIGELEEVLGTDGTDLTDEERKRLDKGVVLMRVGAKMLKHTLRDRGFIGRLKAPKANETV